MKKPTDLIQLAQGFYFSCNCDKPDLACRLWYVSVHNYRGMFWRLRARGRMLKPVPFEGHVFIDTMTSTTRNNLRFERSEVDVMVPIVPLLVPPEVIEQAVRIDGR